MRASLRTSGLYVNQHRSEVSAEVFHFLHEFYEMVAHILNTVIFAIAGCKLGKLIVDEWVRTAPHCTGAP